MGNKIILILFFCFLFGPSCKTMLDIPPCEVREQMVYPDSLLAYFDFKPGSYWIYKDLTTGLEDSVWLDLYVEEESQDFDHKRYCQCDLNKCFKSKTWRYSDITSANQPVSTYNGKDYRTYYMTTYLDFHPVDFKTQSDYLYTFALWADSYNIYCATTWPLYDRSKDANEHGDTFTVIPSMKINGLTYQNVIYMMTYYYSGPQQVYVVRDIGYVEFDVNWIPQKRLIRYHIER